MKFFSTSHIIEITVHVLSIIISYLAIATSTCACKTPYSFHIDSFENTVWRNQITLEVSVIIPALQLEIRTRTKVILN